MEKIILHIDFDSYFASCEQEFNPKLRDKPIGVTATNGRTCIIAASRQAKKLGVKSPSRTWEAIQSVPDMIFVPAQFERYWEITQKFLNICKDYSPYVELFSLDEVFIDITQTHNLFGGKYKLVSTIKKRIREEIGEHITVSVGMSHNKLLAKLASGMNKPDGFMEIKPENLLEVYSKIKLTDLCGIGERIKRHLNRRGIYTPLDLRGTPLSILLKEFKNVEGNFLYNLGHGYDGSPVVPYYLEEETKSVGRNYCIPKNTYDQRLVLQHIYELCEEVALKLRRLNKKGRTVFLYLGGERHMHGRKTVSDHIDTASDIFKVCKKLYSQWQWNHMVRQVHVSVGNLEDSQNITISLFDRRLKKTKAQKVVDLINDKFGDHTIRNGFLLYAPNLKTVPNGYMADKFERTKLAKTTSKSFKSS
jgi:DNA polymerase IV